MPVVKGGVWYVRPSVHPSIHPIIVIVVVVVIPALRVTLMLTDLSAKQDQHRG